MWIEMLLKGLYLAQFPSRPARALWIEIGLRTVDYACGHTVEAREGLVD